MPPLDNFRHEGGGCNPLILNFRSLLTFQRRVLASEARKKGCRTFYALCCHLVTIAPHLDLQVHATYTLTVMSIT